jgi:hypothetical protein
VSIWCGTGDYIWNTQEAGSAESQLTPQALADRYLTEDGSAGRLVDLLEGGGPLVLVTHWQSLFSNGSRLGLATYREIAKRVRAAIGDRVEWRKLSTIAQHFLAAETVRLDAAATRDNITVTATCPFDTDVLTVSIPTPWPLFTGPEVSVDGAVFKQMEDVKELAVGRWLMRGSVVTLSLPLVANTPATIAIRARKP